MNIYLLWTSSADCTLSTNGRKSARTRRVRPRRAVTRDAVFSSSAVGLSVVPRGVAHFGAVGPQPHALLLRVTQPQPGGALMRVKVPEQGSNKVALLLAVDGRQVGVLRQTVLLCRGPAHVRGDVLEAAAVEAQPERRTVGSGTLQLHLS